jgi:peptidoglycan/xylan/chitin deacetylase (PgdA/CDA1 family)
MRIIIVSFWVFVLFKPAFSQEGSEFKNEFFLKKLYKDTSYLNLKKKITLEYAHVKPGMWGEFVKGVIEDGNTKNKAIAFTFDACGGRNGNGCDKELLDFLDREKVPATLFISGLWIDANFSQFLSLGRDTLFEIENHGLNHVPCSIDKESAYGITGTSGVNEAFDEIEANARKIKAIIHYNPIFFRSATTFIDEACVNIARQLGITVVSFHVLSGDAIAHTPVSVIEENVIRSIKPGAIVIMHLNHPEWNTYEAMQKIVPRLRQMGYTFYKLKDFEKFNAKW